MIHYCNVSLKEVQQEQKGYSWVRPDSCPKCKGKLWGHGYVLRYLNFYSKGLYLKRWRCPSCRLILSCRPSSHWRRYQESIKRIFWTLIYRIKRYKWPPWTTRQRGGHWLRTLVSHANTHLMHKESLLNTILFYKHKNLAIF